MQAQSSADPANCGVRFTAPSQFLEGKKLQVGELYATVIRRERCPIILRLFGDILFEGGYQTPDLHGSRDVELCEIEERFKCPDPFLMNERVNKF